MKDIRINLFFSATMRVPTGLRFTAIVNVSFKNYTEVVLICGV